MFRGLKDPFLEISSSLDLLQNSGRLIKPYRRKLVFMEEHTPLLKRVVFEFKCNSK